MKRISRNIENGLVILAASFLLSAGCNKNNTRPCYNGGYSFTVTSEWWPQKEIYNVGDTIFLESVLPKTFTDQINNSIVVNYSNSTGISGDVAIYFLDTIKREAIPAKKDFNFISIIGSFIPRPGNQDGGINILYQETAQTYHFKGGVICTKKGIYGIGVSNLISNGLRGKNCTNAGFMMTVTNTNKHLYLHHYALGVDTNDAELRRTGYDFRVQ